MRILLATDGSEFSTAAAELLKRLPLPASGQIILVTVLEDIAAAYFDPMIDVADPCLVDFEAERQTHASSLLDEQAQRLQRPGWKVDALVRNGDVSHEIIEIAKDTACNLIVVGSHGRNQIDRFLLGSVSQKVVSHAPCSVLVARQPKHAATNQLVAGKPLRILLALDSSASAKAALDRIVTMASHSPLDITITRVLALSRFYRADILEKMTDSWEKQKEAAQEQLESAAAVLRKAGANVSLELIEGSHVSEDLLSIAGQIGANLIVVGHKGHTRLEHCFLGSVARRMVCHAPCSVWVHREE